MRGHLAKICLLTILCVSGKSASLSADSQQGRWVDSWTTVPESVKNRQTGVIFKDTTIRQTVPLTIGASQIRVRFSNAFGLTNLAISKVTVALPTTSGNHDTPLGSPSIDTSTLKNVTFGGEDDIIIPDKALAVSDPITFNPALKAGQVVTISIHLAEGQSGGYYTAHFWSKTSAWQTPGDETSNPMMAAEGAGPHWFFLSAVEAWTNTNYRGFVVLGDSITDGRISTLNANDKWPSMLFHRMQKSSDTNDISVLNQGAGGNQMMQDGSGPNAASRIDRDVLAQAGVGYLLVFEGVNDIGHAPATTAGQQEIETRLKQFYQQVILRAHTFGIPVFGATITPFMCPPHSDWGPNNIQNPLREQTRQSINSWIRSSGMFDAVVDFDAVLRSSDDPAQMQKQFMSKDCMHPNDAGNHALANGFPLEIFSQFKGGVGESLSLTSDGAVAAKSGYIRVAIGLFACYAVAQTLRLL